MKYKIIEKQFYNDDDILDSKYYVKKNYFNLFWFYCKDYSEVNSFFQNLFFITIYCVLTIPFILFSKNAYNFYICETVLFVVLRYLHELVTRKVFYSEYKAQNYLKNRMNEQILKTKETIIEIK